MQWLKDSNRENTASRMTVQIKEQLLLKNNNTSFFPCTSVYALHLLQKTWLSCDNYDAPPNHKPEPCSTTGPYSDPIRLNIICTRIRLLIGTERTCEAYTKHLSALAWEDGQHTHLKYVFLLLLRRHRSFRHRHHSLVWRLLHCTDRKNLWRVQRNQKQLFPCKNPSQ